MILESLGLMNQNRDRIARGRDMIEMEANRQEEQQEQFEDVGGQAGNLRIVYMERIRVITLGVEEKQKQ